VPLPSILLIEISSDGIKEKTLLRRRLKKFLRIQTLESLGQSVKPIRIMNLDDSMIPADISRVIGASGNVPETNIRVRPIRINRSGLGTMVARCPLKVALKIIKDGKIRNGVVFSQSEDATTPPYRCLALGHPSAKYPDLTNRSGA